MSEPVVDRFYQYVLNVPLVLDGVDAKLLNSFWLEPSDSGPLSLARGRPITILRGSSTNFRRLS